MSPGHLKTPCQDPLRRLRLGRFFSDVAGSVSCSHTIATEVAARGQTTSRICNRPLAQPLLSFPTLCARHGHPSHIDNTSVSRFCVLLGACCLGNTQDRAEADLTRPRIDWLKCHTASHVGSSEAGARG